METLEEFDAITYEKSWLTQWDYLVSDNPNQEIKPVISTNQQLLRNYEADDESFVHTYIVW